MPDARADSPALREVLASLEARFPDDLSGSASDKGELAVRVRPSGLAPVLRFLKSELRFGSLQDMIGLDRGPVPAEGTPRFAVLYQLYRFEDHVRIRIAVETDGNEPLDSAVAIWRSADWAEREIYDMFGLRFAGHPDLRRIYLEETFEGYPLRKDFPLGGTNDGF
jgi:NADH-quinone oxidoreductase subunit C